MKYCIFGGSFDPPHEGHRNLARSAFVSLGLDTVFWVPSQDPPHKTTPSTPFRHRVNLVRLAIADMPGQAVSDIEARLPGPSYSLYTIQALKSEFGANHRWYFLIGADNWTLIETWHRWPDVLKEATMVIYPRLGHSVKDLPKGVVGLSMPEFPGESRLIRKALSTGSDLDAAQVLPELRDYIRSQGLYGMGKADAPGIH
ncbi:MAG: nicotinate (nicotinamide) nucleotide adenylyltransferase [Fibrobacterota bacterium]|nr:nicotinate (nicotinamide) nucleotide adenylyltransferase [Fibrobacterota bacterium]